MWVHWALVGCLHGWVYCSEETNVWFAYSVHCIVGNEWWKNKQTPCAAGGVTPKDGSQSRRRCQPKRRVCFLRAGQIVHDLQKRKINLLIHLSQRQSLPATGRGRTRILWLGMPARFKEWGGGIHGWPDKMTSPWLLYFLPSLVHAHS